MNNWLTSILMVVITTLLCFHISCDARVIPQELRKRAFAAPDPEKALTTTRTGLKGLLTATEQALDNQFLLFETKEPAAASGTVPANTDPSTADGKSPEKEDDD